MKTHKIRKSIVLGLTSLVLALFMVPFFIVVINTFKSTPEFIRSPFSIPKEFQLDNFRVAINRMDFFNALKNTATITVLTVLVSTGRTSINASSNVVSVSSNSANFGF